MSTFTATAPQASIHLPPELDHWLETVANREGISKASLALRAIESYLEDLEDVADAEKVLAGIERGEIQVISHKEMERRLALDD